MSSEPTVQIAGTKCQNCHRVSVPSQHFGCEQCGAHGADLVDMTLSGTGRILDALTVRAHPQGLAVPFVLARIHLEEGPVIHARLLDTGVDTPEVRAVVGKGVVARHCDLDGPDLAFVIKENFS